MGITGIIILPRKYFIIEEETARPNMSLIYRWCPWEILCIKPFHASFQISCGWPMPLGSVLLGQFSKEIKICEIDLALKHNSSYAMLTPLCLSRKLHTFSSPWQHKRNAFQTFCSYSKIWVGLTYNYPNLFCE